MCFGEAKGFQMMAIEMFGSFFTSFVHDKVLKMSPFDLALFKGNLYLLL